jgi:hypothetical protein
VKRNFISKIFSILEKDASLAQSLNQKSSFKIDYEIEKRKTIVLSDPYCISQIDNELSHFESKMDCEKGFFSQQWKVF